MSLKKSTGNMYPWVTHTHAHLGGECPHRCSYCYVDNPRFGRPEKFKGPLRLMQEELKIRYGESRTIFIDHCNDLFAEDVPAEWIIKVLDHCAAWPKNTYVYQTKNPGRFIEALPWTLPTCMLGCTIETNRDIPDSISLAPRPIGRATEMMRLSGSRRLFVTIEPVMDFDVPVLGEWLMEIKPEFVNIGADSKGHNLPEPSADKITALIDVMNAAGIKIREKHNLQRLMAK
jgi:DNA repair photolyase